MNKTAAVVVLFLIVVISGVYIQYIAYQCTNDLSHTWQSYAVDGCSLYYIDVDAVKNVDTVEDVSRVLVENAHIPSFKEIDMSYGRDRENVFYAESLVTDADPGSFMNLGGEYYGDTQRVYWQGVSIAQAQVESFELFPAGDERFARDTSNEFFNGKRIHAAPEATSMRFLLSPFDGEEVTRDLPKEIFWRPGVEPDITHLFLATEGLSGLKWIFNDTEDNDGTYMWDVAAASTTLDETYRLVFYAQTPGKMIRISPPAQFRVVEDGVAAVVVSANYSDEEVVDVSPKESVNLSWASSNVERCFQNEAVQQDKIGHMIAQFPVDEGSRATEHIFVVECETTEGNTVSDTVTIRSIRDLADVR